MQQSSLTLMRASIPIHVYNIFIPLCLFAVIAHARGNAPKRHGNQKFGKSAILFNHGYRPRCSRYYGLMSFHLDAIPKFRTGSVMEFCHVVKFYRVRSLVRRAMQRFPKLIEPWSFNYLALLSLVENLPHAFADLQLPIIYLAWLLMS